MKYGRIVDLLIEERFDNFEAAKNVKCPTVIFHGIKDSMVPFHHSLEMLNQGFTQCSAHMFLRDGMEHNKFDYINDIIKPLKFFLKHHDINTKRPLVKSIFNQIKLTKLVGYVDKRAMQYHKMFGIINKSQYYNNFEKKFIPALP